MEPLLSNLGTLVEDSMIDDILQGRYISETDDQYTKQLIENLKLLTTSKVVPPTKDYIDIKDYIEGWKIQKKKTSSNCKELSFSHYIASIQDPILAQFDADIRLIPYQEKFTPKGWESITDLEILKNRSIQYQKMRTIQLMNAEFNINNKKLGKDMMYFAEESRTILRKQYGSSQNHQSIKALLNKRLTCNVL